MFWLCDLCAARVFPGVWLASHFLNNTLWSADRQTSSVFTSPASLVYCLCDFSPLKDTLTRSRSQTCFPTFFLGLAGWTFPVSPMVYPETGLHYSARDVGTHHRRLCFHCCFISIILTWQLTVAFRLAWNLLLYAPPHPRAGIINPLCYSFSF